MFVEVLMRDGGEPLLGNANTTKLAMTNPPSAAIELRNVLCLQVAEAMATPDDLVQASGKVTVGNLHRTPDTGNAMGMPNERRRRPHRLAAPIKADRSSTVIEGRVHGLKQLVSSNPR